MISEDFDKAPVCWINKIILCEISDCKREIIPRDLILFLLFGGIERV